MSETEWLVSDHPYYMKLKNIPHDVGWSPLEHGNVHSVASGVERGVKAGRTGAHNQDLLALKTRNVNKSCVE